MRVVGVCGGVLFPNMAGARPSKPTIVVTLGDPGGIGPECIVRALSDRNIRGLARFHIVGSHGILQAAAQACGVEPYWWAASIDADPSHELGLHDVVVLDTDRAWGAVAASREPTKSGGQYSFRLVETAIAMARAGQPMRVDAIVTGPISKEAWSLAGKGKFPGHTELFASRFGVKRAAMMFIGPSLRVVLATIHIPLMDIRNALTIGRVFDAIDLGVEGCRQIGLARPRVAVCGLNPHAGENGLLGDEEERLIRPAIAHAVEAGMDVRGPFPADTIFNAAVAGKFDLVVAMYHDQGLIPVKLLARDESVNMTVGLPIVRTSPDHGTAFDIAGKGTANPGSMKAALRLAAEGAATAR